MLGLVSCGTAYEEKFPFLGLHKRKSSLLVCTSSLGVAVGVLFSACLFFSVGLEGLKISSERRLHGACVR